MPEAPGIYKLSHRTSGDTYIGQAENMLVRVRQHFSGLRAGKHPSKKVAACASEYGADGFLAEVVERCDTDALDEREAWWINRLNPSLNTMPGGTCANLDTTSIRIEVQGWVDEKLGEWAEDSRRSKREHAAHIIEQLVACYESDPHVLDWLALYRAGEVRFEMRKGAAS